MKILILILFIIMIAGCDNRLFKDIPRLDERSYVRGYQDCYKEHFEKNIEEIK